MNGNGGHRFSDEWLLRLVGQLPGFDSTVVAQWRLRRRDFLSQALVDHGVCTFEELGALIQKRLRIEFEWPDPESLDRALLSVVPEATCRKYGLAPKAVAAGGVTILTANPVDLDAQREVEWATNRSMTPVYCLPDHLEHVLLRLLTPDAVVFDLLKRLEVQATVEVVVEGDEVDPGTSPGDVRAPVIRLVNAIVADALQRGASDIHVEHEDQASVVRYRVDGMLRKAMVLPRYIGAGPLVSRVKIMADLDLAERRRPQDGRAKVRVDGHEVGLRVSTLPTRLGEKVVIRILDERTARVPLDRLGFHGDVRTRLENLASRSEGILLVTGPTGSGKTTTLYSLLNSLNGEEANLVTVEDPVEYRLPGVNQVQVQERQGMGFAAVLRSLLRQDPDVIMVGEIRDHETADIACQAALTGHMVLSTLHTNDTVTAVARLVDMGVEPFKVAAGLVGVTAQRLVRRVCPSCSSWVDAHDHTRDLGKAMARAGLETGVRVAVGCHECDHTGYKGRLSLVELLEVDEELKGLIAAGAGAPELKHAALRKGKLHTMTRDILRHLADGTTTPEEVTPHLDLTDGQLSSEIPPVPGPAEVSQGEGQANRVARVVVAVSDPELHAGIAEEVATLGATPLEAASPHLAVALVATSDPDALILGPGGHAAELLAIVRGQLGLRDLPVLALASSDDEVETLLAAGADDFLRLPFRPEAVRARLRAVLGRGRRWPEPWEIMPPRLPATEADRREDLRSLGTLDTPEEERFDRLAREAADAFGVPIALVSLVDADRQWFKSHHGLASRGTPRDISFCGHAILDDEVFVVEDACLDARFVHNPLVTGDPHIRFYAGYPLHGPKGHRIGSFCVVDHKQRQVHPHEIATLERIGRQVEQELWKTALESHG